MAASSSSGSIGLGYSYGILIGLCRDSLIRWQFSLSAAAARRWDRRSVLRTNIEYFDEHFSRSILLNTVVVPAACSSSSSCSSSRNSRLSNLVIITAGAVATVAGGIIFTIMIIIIPRRRSGILIIPPLLSLLPLLFIPLFLLSQMTLRREPIADPLPILKMFGVDMIEPLVPRLQALLFQRDDHLAESAPELRLAVPSDAILADESVDVLPVLDLVVLAEMLDVHLLPVEQARTLQACGVSLRTAPALEVEVLGILVSLPVRLAAEGLVAFGKRTAVGPFMTLHMFSNRWQSEKPRRRTGRRAILQLTTQPSGLGTEVTLEHSLFLRLRFMTQRLAGLVMRCSGTRRLTSSKLL